LADESVDLELDLNGNTAAVAKKMAAELRRLDDELEKVRKSSAKVDRAFAKSKAFSPQQAKDLAGHANAVVRLQKAHTKLAPASAFAAKALRTFGVSGASLRRVSIDAAKSEIALRRLYRLKGGGVSGAASVAGAVGRRGVAKYGGTVARGAMSGVGSLVGMAGNAAMIGGGAALAGGGLLGFNMAATAIEAERVRFALDQITNGQGEKWWATSADYAKRFGLNVNAVAENLMNMKASGFTDDMTKTLFLRMGDLRSLGATEETIGRALLAIRQVQAAGRLQGDELNQLSEAGINANFVYDDLAKTLGKTVPEIIKMKEAGKLTSDIVIPSIARAIGTKTGGKEAGVAGETAASKTVSGQWGRLKGAFSVASTQAIGSDALAPLRASLANFTAWISGPGGANAIGAFGGLMNRVFAAAPRIIEGVIWFLDVGLPAAWQAFSTAFAVSGGTAAWDALLGGAATLGGPGGAAVVEKITGMATAVGSLAGALVSLINVLTPVISGLATLAQYTVFGLPTLAGKISGFFSGGEDTTGAAANDNAGAAASGMTIGQSMAIGMQNGLTYGAPGVAQAAALLGQTAENALRVQQEVHSPGRKMMAIGGYDAKGYALGMQQGIPRIEDASASMGSSATSGASAANEGGGGASIQINVYLDGKEVSGRSEGEIGDIIGERIERKLASIFRRVA
jgi:tape measure domain-containing protein